MQTIVNQSTTTPLSVVTTISTPTPHTLIMSTIPVSWYHVKRSTPLDAFYDKSQPTADHFKGHFHDFKRVRPRISDKALLDNEGFYGAYLASLSMLKGVGTEASEIIFLNGEAFVVDKSFDNVLQLVYFEDRYVCVWVRKSEQATEIHNSKHTDPINASTLFNKDSVLLQVNMGSRKAYCPHTITAKEYEAINHITLQPSTGKVFRDGIERVTEPKQRGNRQTYFMRFNIDGKTRYFNMQRLIWCAANGVKLDDILNFDIDHINGDTLDNRIGNLQLVIGKVNSALNGIRSTFRDLAMFRP